MNNILKARKHDFIILPESHSTHERLRAFGERSDTSGLRMFASHHEDVDKQTSSGGIAIVFREDFLGRFEEGVRCKELVTGRLLLVTLKGKEGTLQIAAVYGDTGTGAAASREECWTTLAESALPQDESTLLLAGDFNMIEDPNQRCSWGEEELRLGIGTLVGGEEKRAWDNLKGKLGLYDLEQPMHTYFHKGQHRSAHLDRVYSNLHVAEQHNWDQFCDILPEAPPKKKGE